MRPNNTFGWRRLTQRFARFVRLKLSPLSPPKSLNLYLLSYPTPDGTLALWLCSTIIYLTHSIVFWCSVNLATLRFHQTEVFRSSVMDDRSCLSGMYCCLNGRYDISQHLYFILVSLNLRFHQIGLRSSSR